MGACGLPPEIRLFPGKQQNGLGVWGLAGLGLQPRLSFTGVSVRGASSAPRPSSVSGLRFWGEQGPGKGTESILEGCPALGHWNQRPSQAVTERQCHPLKPPQHPP